MALGLAITGALLAVAGGACMIVSIWRHPWGHAGISLLAAGDLLLHQWPYLGLVAGMVVLDLYVHWRRRKRKRAAKKIDAKSRARIADLIGTMRERARQRPALRPTPGGAS
jgi:hypothetical protein